VDKTQRRPDVLFDALVGGDKPLVARNALGDLHSSPEQRFWLLQDIQALIEKTALRGPLLICLDDLHLAGDGCAEAMRQLPRQLASLPVGSVMAYRPDQGLPVLQGTTGRLEEAGPRWSGSARSRVRPSRRSPWTFWAPTPMRSFCAKSIKSGETRSS
jgi:hypothetical protein